MTGANPILEELGAIENAAARFIHHGRRPQQRPAPVATFTPAAQQPQPEVPVTTPQQPASVVESLHAITGEIQANPLVARLVQYRIGTRLTPDQADHFVALIADVEQPRTQVAANDSTQQQPVIKQQ